MNGVPGWLWPKVEKINPTGFVRLGRVLHWAISGFGAIFFLMGCAILLMMMSGTAPGGDQTAMVGVAVFGFVVVLIGRAARYIFSGE